MGTFNFIGIVCCVGFLVLSVLLIIPSCSILVILKNRTIEAGYEQKSSVIHPHSEQWIPFSPLDCPQNMSQFYEIRILTYLRVTASKDSKVTLSIYESNSTDSAELAHCTANAHDDCSLFIPDISESVSAFLSLDNSTNTSQTVDWGCYYLNIPVIVCYAVLGCSGFLFLVSLCCTCICCLVCCCDDEFGDHKGAKLVSPHVSHRTLSTPRYTRTSVHPSDKTPLVIQQQHIETGYVDGAKVIRHYSTVDKQTNGRASENFITDDSTIS